MNAKKSSDQKKTDQDKKMGIKKKKTSSPTQSKHITDHSLVLDAFPIQVVHLTETQNKRNDVERDRKAVIPPDPQPCQKASSARRTRL
jgi:hypothetical protein